SSASASAPPPPRDPSPVTGPEAGPRTCGTSAGNLDVVRLRPLLALHDLELDVLALVEGLVAVAPDRRVVDEHVRAAAIDGDEPETLLRVEPLDGAVRHDLSPCYRYR